MITSYTVRIGGHFERTWIICHFNVPVPPQLISFLTVPVSSFFLVWFIYTVCLFLIIYITFIWYLLITFLDDIELWCNLPVVFRGCWLLKTPEIIIIGLFIDFSFVWLHSIFNAHTVALVPCFCLYLDILVLEESYEALLIDVTTKMF